MKRLMYHFILIILMSATVPGLSQVSFTEHPIVSNYNSWSACAVDMDYDGDIDIVGSSRLTNNIDWWENDGSQNFTRHTVSTTALYPMGIGAADFDYDGDMDIVCGLNQANQIDWWENDGNFNFTAHLIVDWVVNRLRIIDVDGDSIIDVVASACEQDDNRIGWLKNDGHGNFTAHIIKDNWDHANSIYATDMDLDGDIDILGTASFRTHPSNGEIAWFENDGNENFTEHKIKINFGRPSGSYAADVDGDGDIDVLATACLLDQIMWFENDGDQNYTQHILGTNFRRPHDVLAIDIDKDGDVDILGAATDSNEISWWENDGSQNFTKHVITNSFRGATEIFIKDIDLDGDLDILGAAQYINQISWWENSYYGIQFSVDVTSGHAPLAVQFNDLSNLNPPIASRSWDFDNNGIVDSHDQAPTWTYEEPGIYTVTLEVSNNSATHKIVKENFVHVFDGASALLFNERNSNVTCVASSSLNLTDAVTIEAWIKPSGWGTIQNLGYGRIVDKTNVSLFLSGDGGALNRHSLAVWLSTVSGTPGFSNSPENSISLDRWQHVAMTYYGSNSTIKMYIDGVEQSVNQAIGQHSGNIKDNLDINFLIGNTANQIAFDGIIDEVRLWNVVRSIEEIQSNINNYLRGDEPGLVGYWRMDEANGIILNDGSKNDNNGTIDRAAWIQGMKLNAPTVIKYIQNEGTELPDTYYLSQNFPNPFNPETTIQFNLPIASEVNITIYDVTGKKVKALMNQKLEAGSHKVKWNGTNIYGQSVTSGVYLYKFNTSKFKEIKKMLLLK